MWTGFVNLGLGFWVFISGSLSSLQVTVNYVVTGIFLIAFNFLIAFKTWQGIVCGILGVLLLLSGIIVELQAGITLVGIGSFTIIIGYLLIKRTERQW